MKKDINIAEILKDMPIGTKLYSSVYGECEFQGLDPDFTGRCIAVKKEADTQRLLLFFYYNGKFYETGECLLFPSKSMRNWKKFGWKKGDVLVSDSGRKEVIFDHYTDDCFKFVGRHLLITDEEGCRYSTDKITLVTEMYSPEEKDAAQCYVNTLQEMLNGKLNKDTLEIEKKEEHTLKPFDKVLVRDTDWGEWRCAIFSHMAAARHTKYITTDLSWRQCIPYEGNEHLLGTTLNPDEK